MYKKQFIHHRSDNKVVELFVNLIVHCLQIRLVLFLYEKGHHQGCRCSVAFCDKPKMVTNDDDFFIQFIFPFSSSSMSFCLNIYQISRLIDYLILCVCYKIHKNSFSSSSPLLDIVFMSCAFIFVSNFLGH